MTPRDTTTKGGMPKASLRETAGFMAGVAMPTIAKGVLIRRPRVMRMGERLNLDQRAVMRLQRLRARHGYGPVILPIPLQPRAIILAPDDVHRVLEGSPVPFATASPEKSAALAHFEPKGALISDGLERTVRRRFNEETLDTAAAVHRLADDFLAVVDQEAAALLATVNAEGVLDWDRFFTGWMRMVRRVVLGDGARDDHALTDTLEQLRAAANWAFLRPKNRPLRAQFHHHLNRHLARAEAGSLAAAIAAAPKTAVTAPSHQVAQWLFAFDPGGMNTLRTLALLASHPEHQARAREEVDTASDWRQLSYLRACYLDTLRLWPTTPVILRQTTHETEWASGLMPAGTGIVIFAPFFHRDDERLPYAHRFAPEVWLEPWPPNGWPLIPFSAGPAACPARNLVPMLGSAMLAALLTRCRMAVETNRVEPDQPLPGTLNPYTLRFHIAC